MLQPLYGHARARNPDQTNKQNCVCVSNAEKVGKYFTNKNKKKIRRGGKFKEIINDEWIIHD